MSTQPTPAASAKPSPMVSIFQKLIAAPELGKITRFFLWVSHFGTTHEKLIAIVLGVALVWGVSGKVQDIIIAHDKKKFDAATATLTAQANSNATLAKNNADLAAQVQAALQRATDQNAKLEQTNATLADALKKQQATDSTLPPAALANRIQTLASLPAGAIAPAPGNTFSVTDGGAVQLAQTLENVPVLQNQLANVQQEKLADDQSIAEQGKLITGLNQQVTGLQSQIKDSDVAHAAEIKLVKAQAAKSKRKWFVAGYVAGLATRGVVKILGGV